MTATPNASLTLVAYATRHGSTASVARAVANRLRRRGLEVDIAPAADIDSVASYGAVVIGGALYVGRWHRDARRFLRRHRSALAQVPLAVFGMGPVKQGQEDLDGAHEQLERALLHVPEVTPVDVAVFGGVIDPSTLHFPLSRMPAYDGRDWNAIDAWADTLVERFALRAPATVR
jgi:menaquinone-dependent protoporphyrinogen oxidase